MSSCLQAKIQVIAVTPPHPLVTKIWVRSVWMLLTWEFPNFTWESTRQTASLRLTGFLKGSGLHLSKRVCGKVTYGKFWRDIFEGIQSLSWPRNDTFRILVRQMWRQYLITFSASLLSERRRARHLLRWIGGRSQLSASFFDQSEKSINKHKSPSAPQWNALFRWEMPYALGKRANVVVSTGRKSLSKVLFSWAHRKPRIFLATR